MMIPLIIVSKLIAKLSRILNIGSGGTWPGEVVLRFQPAILAYFFNQVKKGIIIIAGTNGKTTTTKLITEILAQKEGGKSTIIHNSSGANLINGLVSAFLSCSNLLGRIDKDWAVLEVDENSLPLVISNDPINQLSNKKKLIIVLLNLFRDQLDRYGEVDSIVTKWEKTLAKLPSDATLILNADDPQVAYLGKNKKFHVVYFGIDKPDKFLSSVEHATDSTYCRNCGKKLQYIGIYFSHIGIWHCPSCDNRRPKVDSEIISSNLVGLYNEYNTLAAVAVAKQLGITKADIETALEKITPAFGRQEEIVVQGKKVKIFLSKNPAGFNASLRAVLESGARHILFVLNDRIPDGRDVSWIWDVDFEMVPEAIQIIVSGDRVYDMALRIKYARKMQNAKIKMQNDNEKLKINENLKDAIFSGLNEIKENETFYILPTYSAMLAVRKILKGRKIL